MPIFKVKLKWNKEVYEDVEVDTEKDAQSFKETIEGLTGVPADRQKVMAKGLWKGTLKDDTEMASLPWKNGQLVAMMGTATKEAIQAPKEETVFVEDMSTGEKQKAMAIDPPGLVNLGNTCFMNSTLQALRVIPELRSSLEASPLDHNSADVGERMVVALRDLFKQMDASEEQVTPTMFVQMMRLAFPQFAQFTQRGGYEQQDVDEFYNELMQVLSHRLTQPGPSATFGSKGNVVNAYFSIEMSTRMKCIETDDEPVIEGSDTLRRLQCNITENVAMVEQGIGLALESEIEKHSDVLKRNALWKQTSRIHKLPKYLVVQFNRFFWKRTPDSRDHQGINCKILKPVKFSMTLDVFDYCDEELRAILASPRKAYAKKRMGKGKVKEQDGDEDMEDDEELQAALKMSMGQDPDASTGIGIRKDFRGVYELFACITHKGRASNSGHYMSWIKQDDGPDSWIVFDDEMPSRCKSADVAQLYGGGDYDMNYLCLYRVPEKDEP